MTQFDDHADSLQADDWNSSPCARDGAKPGGSPTLPANLRRPARPWFDVMVTTRGEVLDDREGHDATLIRRAIERAQASYWSGFESDCHGPAAQVEPDLYAVGQGDQVVWNGLQVVAILRPRLNGTLEVVQLSSVPWTT